jgi:hypothetical protein
MNVDTMGRKNGRPSDSRDFAIKVGGAAILIGLLSGQPKVRKILGYSGLLLLGSALAPDFIRYMKIESM